VRARRPRCRRETTQDPTSPGFDDQQRR
jgi:hypothetical protein